MVADRSELKKDEDKERWDKFFAHAIQGLLAARSGNWKKDVAKYQQEITFAVELAAEVANAMIRQSE